jgi:hypothetical protein
MTYVLAPEYTPLVGPAVFLAGPIQGAPNWQPLAAQLIVDADSALHVCSPRREAEVSGDFNDVKHGEQVDWETTYLRRCAADGVVLFWLPAAEKETPGRSYAQTTRFELGNWEECARRGEVKLVVGIAPDFGNARYLRRRLAQDCPRTPVCQTLEETCAAAVELANAPAGSTDDSQERVLDLIEAHYGYTGYFPANREHLLQLLRTRAH